MMHEVSKIDLPADSLLHRFVGPNDFLDCYAVASNLPPRAAAEEIVRFPGWARALVAFRNVLVAPFGVLADGPDTGDKLGPFPVVEETDAELIAGFDDRHLDFRISVMSRDGKVSLATWVHPHNFGGRAYLAAIMPFHVAIARDALRRVSRLRSELLEA